MFYFDFRTWARMLGYATREPDRRRKRKLFSLLLLRVPAIAGLNAICFALDPLFFPGLRRTEIREPVFVVGHGRSGTTHLHDLLYQDGEPDDRRFSSFLMYELYFSALLPKVLIRAVARWDDRYLGGALARRMAGRSDARYSKTRDAHHQSLTYPEEDDGILTYSCASGAWSLRVPDLRIVSFHYVDEWPERRRKRLMGFYRECVRRQLYLNGSNRIHLSKNPTFAGRIESLIEFFPDAKFVVPYRNPLETIPSLLKLMQGFWRIRGVDEEVMRASYPRLIEQSFDTYRHPAEVFERHPETQVSIVDYRDLVREPRKVIEQVYADFGYELSAEYSRKLDLAQAAVGHHETRHRYSLEEFDLSEAKIRRELCALFERFDWPGSEDVGP